VSCFLGWTRAHSVSLSPGCRASSGRVEKPPFRTEWCDQTPTHSVSEASLAKGRRLNRIVAFLAETPGSATIEDQQACLSPADLAVFAGRKTFNQLGELLSRQGIRLTRGDRVKVHDLSCLSLTTPMLIRVVAKLLKTGISFEICTPKIVIEPDGDDKLHAMFEALDNHYRHLHGVKTHPPEMAQPGRKRLLDPEKLPEIQEKLNQPGATATDVAQALGVSRSTLFNYLERYDLDRRLGRDKKGVNRRSKHSSDEGQLIGGNPDAATI